ncbi:MAG TPA: hypothetical protein VEI04_00640 [Syntrophobacteria bacterium]|nr:hypothetical protein [Syntrophobacteria bacterium]
MRKLTVGAVKVEDATFIDEGIKPLVASLSGWSEIKTINSCEGHGRRPFVVFRSSDPCQVSIGGLLDEFRKRLKGTKWEIFRNDIGYCECPEDRRAYPAFTVRPYKRAKRFASVQEVAELVKCPTPCEAWVVHYKYGKDGRGRKAL